MKLWIRLDAGTPRDPKITELARALGVRRAEAFGLAASVWCVMAEHAVDGSLAGLADEDLEAWAYWQGRRGRFAAAFRATFMSPDGMVGGWSERQGALLDRMERDRKRHQKPRGNSAETPRKFLGNSAEVPGNLLGVSASTERNGTEQKKELVSARSRSTPKAPPENPPATVPASVYDHCLRAWTEQAGAVDIPRFRKVTKPAFLGGVRAGQFVRAVPRYVAAMRERNRPIKLEWFVEDIQTWIRDADISGVELMSRDAFGLTEQQAAEHTRAHYASLAESDAALHAQLTQAGAA